MRLKTPLKRLPRRRAILALLGLLFLALVAGLIIYPYYKSYVAPWRQTVLKVNDTVFDMRYYVKMLRLWPREPETDTAVLTMQVLMNIQNGELIRQEALRRNISVTEEEVTQEIKRSVLPLGSDQNEFEGRYKEMLQEIGLSEAEYRELVRTDLLAVRLRDDLGRQLPTTADQVHVYAILTDTENKVEEIKTRLSLGEDFAKVAQSESLHISRGRGGDLGWLSKGLDDTLAIAQVRVLGILVETQEEAEQVRARVEGGENFAEVAKEVSLDELSREKGGDLGWVARGVANTPFDEAVFALEPGALSQPVETISGYLVVKVLEKAPEGKIIDDIAFGLPIGEVSPPLLTRDGYYLLKVSEKAANRSLDEGQREMLKDKALERWLEEAELKGVEEGRIEWYWDLDRYTWAMKQIK